MNTVIITGATSGIGFATACLLASKNYHVLGVGHRKETCEQAKAAIKEKIPSASITFFSADLMQQKEVFRLAGELKQHVEQNGDGAISALINNAGCVRNWHMTTEEGYEQQFAVNYLAGFLLTHKMLPLLLRGHGRVIMTGSESHKGIKVHWDDVMLRRRYHPLKAYKQSKLCNVLFAKGLNDRYRSAGVNAYAVDPGLVRTDIGNKTGGIVRLVWTLRKRWGIDPEIPAKTYAFLCEAEKDPGGLYYYLCREKAYSKQVTKENADRLFALSEQLCGITFGKEEAE